jgi:hypothetical protein
MTDRNLTTPNVPPTGRADFEPAPSVKPDSKLTARGKRGGKAAKQTLILTGLGVDVPPALDLTTHENRLALLRAIVEAVVAGKCSGLTAQVLLSAVREARAERQDELERLTQLQAQEIARLRTSA